MTNTQKLINNEEASIKERFGNLFLYLLGFSIFSKKMIFKLKEAVMELNNPAYKKNIDFLTGSIINLLSNMDLFANRVKINDDIDLPMLKEEFLERAQLISIILSRLPTPMHRDFINFMTEFYQGQVVKVEDNVIDAILDYEEGALEGMALVKEINPSLTPEQVEVMARKMMKWSDFRHTINRVNA